MSLRPALVLVAIGQATKRARRVEAIERAGYRVLETLDGFEALAAATRYLPDVVVADLVLPKLDALEFVTRLRMSRDTSDIPTILIRDRASDVDGAEPYTVVSTDEQMLERLEQLTTERTPDSEKRRTLRRALADVRASAERSREVEMDVAERARLIASSVEETMISVLVADDEAHYVEANNAICALTGYSRAQLLSMTIWDLAGQDRTDQTRRAWSRFLRDGRFEGPYRIRRRTGEEVTIHCSAAANVVPGLHVSTMAPTRLLDVIRS